MKRNEIYLGDCLELMPKHVEDKSIDMIFCDLPYGTTKLEWDIIIPFKELWTEYERVIKDNGVIVLFGCEPFSSALRMSNIKNYKYDWKWEKSKATLHQLCKKRPMKSDEDIMVFYSKQPTYNPQMILGEKYKGRNNTQNHKELKGEWKIKQGSRNDNNGLRYPRTNIKIANENKKGMHPTQKPLELIEYMIKTYTNEGDLILDNTCGSGTTGLGAKNLNRDYIMMEQDPEYYEIACKRVLT
tara:strand:+ start:84 stop:809 length:726 start_codon:yes stop_codon:yes gene_type:complete